MPQPFLAELEQFLAETRIPPTRFGRLVVNDMNFVRQVRQGRSPRLDTVELVRTLMERMRREHQRKVAAERKAAEAEARRAKAAAARKAKAKAAAKAKPKRKPTSSRGRR